jgi:dTDP-4-dehydrorhamnose reductase
MMTCPATHRSVAAAMGSFDWDSLVTQMQRHYEVGAFDVRGPEPRPTAIAHLISDLASHRKPRRTALATEPGWWERAFRSGDPDQQTPTNIPRTSPAPLLVTGASGTLGRAFTQLCAVRGLCVRAYSRAELDICDAGAIAHELNEAAPWAVINTAGYVRVDAAELDSERCYRENSGGANCLQARVPRADCRSSHSRPISCSTVSGNHSVCGNSRRAATQCLWSQQGIVMPNLEDALARYVAAT